MKKTFLRYHALAITALLAICFGCTKKEIIRKEQSEIATETGSKPGDPGECIECPTYREGPLIVTGNGSAEVESGTKITLSINAQRYLNGNSTGKLIYHFQSSDVGFEMDIDCITFIGSSVKVNLKGRVTKVFGSGDATAYDLFVGQTGLLSVLDEGEGNSPGPDLIGHMYLLSTIQDCGGEYTTQWPITGNIQIMHKFLPLGGVR